MVDIDTSAAHPRIPFVAAGTETRRGPAYARRSRMNSARKIVVLLSADVAALVASVSIAGAIAYLVSWKFLALKFSAFESVELPARLGVWAVLITGLCAWFYISGHYTVRRPLREDVPRIGAALLLVMLIDGFVQFATKADFSRAWLVSVWVAAAATLPLFRIGARGLLESAGVWERKALLIGHGSHAAEVRDGLSKDSYLGYRIQQDSDFEWFSVPDRNKLGELISDHMARSGVEVFILVPDGEELQNCVRLIDVLNIQMVPYAIVPPIHRLPLVGLDMQAFLSSDAILMTVKSGLLNPLSRTVKRGFDLVAAGFLLVLLAPLLLVVAGLVALDGGVVTFGHPRVGHGGRSFRCLKFRSMVPDASSRLEKLLAENEELRHEWLTTYKLKDDPRVTAIGKFLRKTSLDELPQLVNVLQGSMSLVGPRPVVATELSQYYGEDAVYYQLVRPGITGLWQISGRSDTGYDRRVHLDAWYVRNWSLWNDVLILLGTLPSVLRSRGAY